MVSAISGSILRPPASTGRDVADTDVAVIGAGPYGMSAAVHLRSTGLNVRVFGEPMEFWATKMPEGMLLRSPRVASNISDPDSAFTLDSYESASGLLPVAPVPLETFVDYGRWFQHQLGSAIDPTTVITVVKDADTFCLSLSNGRVVRARRVVVAAGVGPFSRKPTEFLHLPSTHVSHCYEGTNLKQFSGQRVAVIGAGQSALESAALLHEAGSFVEVIARIPELRWIGMHSWLHHLGPLSNMLYSSHDVGPAGISRLVAEPRLVYRVPLKLRDKLRKRAVRSAGSRWLPERLTNVRISTGRKVRTAIVLGDEIVLTLDDGRVAAFDRVLLGTGYDVDIARYDFLSRELVRNLAQFDGYPKLTAGFCSSVPGLHFIGATAARSFGPLLYFVAGTEFASRELTAYVSRRTKNAK